MRTSDKPRHEDTPVVTATEVRGWASSTPSPALHRRSAMGTRHRFVWILMIFSLAPLAIAPANAVAAEDGQVFRVVTAMDLPGRGSIMARLQLRCSAGQVQYVTVDFATPRLSDELRIKQVSVRQRFGPGQTKPSKAPWALRYQVLPASLKPEGVGDAFYNLQLDRMRYTGDGNAFLEQMRDHDYFVFKAPAEDRGAELLFDLTHARSDLERFRHQCGI